jgi:hypothetical protein
MSDFPITIDDIVGRKKYVSDELGDFHLNCHIGHRKLLCAVLEFLIEAQKHEIDLDDTFIIYIGSAPGISLNVIEELYPNIKWLLYDKNKFLIHNKTGNFTFKHQYFFDEDIPKARKIYEESGKKHFLFICDMRDEPKEEEVLQDMLMQQRWLLELGCEGFSLKFRLPYYIEDKIYKYNIPKQFGAKNIKFELNKMLYLDGKIFTQAYAPKRSTETRLIAFKQFNLKEYDIIDYEEKCCYLNTVMRLNKFIYKDSEDYLFYNQYDDVREYQIYYDFNSLNKTFDNIDEIYSLVNNIFKKYNIVNGVECKIVMFYKRIDDINSNNNIVPVKKKLFLTFLTNKLKIIIDKINNSKSTKDNKYRNLRIKIDNNYIKYNHKTKRIYLDEKAIFV